MFIIAEASKKYKRFLLVSALCGCFFSSLSCCTRKKTGTCLKSRCRFVLPYSMPEALAQVWRKSAFAHAKNQAISRLCGAGLVHAALQNRNFLKQNAYNAKRRFSQSYHGFELLFSVSLILMKFTHFYANLRHLTGNWRKLWRKPANFVQ